jgi:EmrB/QacA subfamily drug resistance transporter
MTTSQRSPLLLPVLFTGTFMVILDVFVVNVAAPSIRTDLGASEGDVQWVVAGYLLAFAVTLITAGRIGDVAGRRRTFRAGLVLFSAASALCAVAPTPQTLIAARVVQGIGGSLVWPQVLSVIQVEFPASERPSRLATMAGVQGLASIAGQIIGGGLLALDLFGLDWRWVFLINLPFGVAAWALAPSAIPESRSPTARRLDLRGVGAGTVFLLLVLLPVVEGRELGWPAWTIACAIAAIPAGIGFVWLERRIEARGGSPLVELRLYAERGFRLGTAALLVVFFVVSVFLLLAIYLQDGMGLSALDSGLVFLPLAIAFATGAQIGPRLIARIGTRVPALGALVAGAGVGALALAVGTAGGELELPTLMPALIPLGFGMGMFVPGAINVVLRAVPPEDAGAAAGMTATTQQVGNALGVAAIGAVFFAALGDRGDPAAYAHAFTISCSLQALAALTGAALVLRIGREPAPRGEPAPAGVSS